MNRDPVVEAVRDTVQVRSSEQSPRTKMNRSNTEMPPAHSTSRPSTAPQSRRSHSQDSGLQVTAVERSKSGGKKTAKKGSSHADVIDRLDFSGVGPMFHHDGPFDACAPSRNRHRTKAPMMAWSAVTDADKEALASAKEMPRAYESPYPSPDVYVPYEAPKKKHDAIAEAWGIHEPEPFEDFSAGGGISRLHGDSHISSRNGTSRRTQERAQRERHRESGDDARPSAGRRQQSKRGTLPPPQPVFVPEAEAEYAQQPSTGEPPSPNGTPTRTKSLIRRIRKMRDSPNVPMGRDEDAPRDPSPTSSGENSATTHSHATSNGNGTSRPTHRAQNSFLGRFGRAANIGRDLSPTAASDDGGYVYVEDLPPVNKEKSLPATPGVKAVYSPPGENSAPDYFNAPIGDAAMSPGASLGRKTSLMNKVRGVVKAAKA